jgi:transcriptional regulator with XRE-family HTH domain
MTLGDRIKELREEKHITQEELAKHISSTKQTIHKYENNIVTNIPSDKIERIANVLNSTPAYLMGWTNEKERVENPKYNLVDTPLYKALDKLGIAENDLTSDEINNIVKFVEFIKNSKNDK